MANQERLRISVGAMPIPEDFKNGAEAPQSWANLIANTYRDLSPDSDFPDRIARGEGPVAFGVEFVPNPRSILPIPGRIIGDVTLCGEVLSISHQYHDPEGSLIHGAVFSALRVPGEGTGSYRLTGCAAMNYANGYEQTFVGTPKSFGHENVIFNKALDLTAMGYWLVRQSLHATDEQFRTSLPQIRR